MTNQTFSIDTRQSVGNLHIAIGGEFNGMCAWELFKAIRRHDAGSGRVFVNTADIADIAISIPVITAVMVCGGRPHHDAVGHIGGLAPVENYVVP